MKCKDIHISDGALFTDQYQLTMAQLYFKMGMHKKKARFDHFFREYPDYGQHKAGYCINAGLEWLINWMEDFNFTDEDIAYLRNQKNPSGSHLFEDDFLKWLKEEGNFDKLDLFAIPEGRVIHPNVPITVVSGPLAMAQILETALLNKLNYQILVATRASRMRLIGRGQLLLEFGARRAHDRGAIAATRAALIGGADYSSNVGISHLLGYPPKGTHAHSMVQIFLALGMSEYDAFKSYAELYPENCILLVDTINTIESGIPNAIKVFEEMRRHGHKPMGIRLDSGDLAYLAIQAAKMLNNAGFDDVSIVLSNELDELNIWQIITEITREAPIYGVDADKLITRLIYGVGTRLITSEGYSALGGVYKLTSVEDKDGWQAAIKISESLSKIPNPGNKMLQRIYDHRNKAIADILSLESESIENQDTIKLFHPNDSGKQRVLERSTISSIEYLYKTIIQSGKIIYEFPSIEEIRRIRDDDIERLDSGVKRLVNPHVYHVSLSEKLWRLKNDLINKTIT
ncbi:MAG TPA: nicotinate phosphoribosyltransferase [Caldithrix sp.]|nr:nicotinate phosphoribosyltransferase [Calditrichaceae bacterium]HEM49077.1 nicotinate phosphoribosyltransferase [Caldithrix sp.]